MVIFLEFPGDEGIISFKCSRYSLNDIFLKLGISCSCDRPPYSIFYLPDFNHSLAILVQKNREILIVIRGKNAGKAKSLESWLKLAYKKTSPRWTLPRVYLEPLKSIRFVGNHDFVHFLKVLSILLS